MVFRRVDPPLLAEGPGSCRYPPQTYLSYTPWGEEVKQYFGRTSLDTPLWGRFSAPTRLVLPVRRRIEWDTLRDFWTTNVWIHPTNDALAILLRAEEA